MPSRTFARKVRIAPSLLAADFARLKDQIAQVEAGGADWLHVDVMDGVFVPNLSFGAKVIETCRSISKLPLDVHLMVVEPEKVIFDTFAKAGASVMTIHVETGSAPAPADFAHQGTRLRRRRGDEPGHVPRHGAGSGDRPRPAPGHERQPGLRGSGVHSGVRRQNSPRAGPPRRRRKFPAALEVDG